jgi:N utilization substance protein A
MNALKPAEINRIDLFPQNGKALVIVDEDQLSLAIGRNGQNVRLASELTGWKIDLYSSREWLERGGEGPLFAPLPSEDEAVGNVPLNSLEGLSPELVTLLEAAGFTTLSDVLDLEREDIEKVAGMSPALTDQMMSFLAELIGEDASDGEAPPA